MEYSIKILSGISDASKVLVSLVSSKNNVENRSFYFFKLKNYSFFQSYFKGPENVVGTNRYRYFRRPIVPYSQAPVDVILEPAKPQIQEEIDVGTHRTIETQTDYRDQESQTEPYSPAFRVKPGIMVQELLKSKNLKQKIKK